MIQFCQTYQISGHKVSIDYTLYSSLSFTMGLGMSFAYYGVFELYIYTFNSNSVAQYLCIRLCICMSTPTNAGIQSKGCVCQAMKIEANNEDKWCQRHIQSEDFFFFFVSLNVTSTKKRGNGPYLPYIYIPTGRALSSAPSHKARTGILSSLCQNILTLNVGNLGFSSLWMPQWMQYASWYRSRIYVQNHDETK